MNLPDPYELPVNAPVYVAGIERPPRDEDKVRRDGKGRPYIKELDVLGNLTGRDVTYTRVTTFIDCVDDKSNLARWGERQLVKGLLGARGARFRAEASSMLTDDQKFNLNNLIRKAKEAAGAEDQAAIGTAVHAITERYDLGLPLGEIDDLYAGDLKAYIDSTKFIEHILVERLLVNDEIQTAGTPDRVSRYLPCEVCGKDLFIFDLKTGRVDNYTQNAQAMQLSVYAHSKVYDPATGVRTDLPDICLHKGIICALPAGTGQAQLQWIDIATGWKLVQVAKAVRKARNVKAQRVPFVAVPNVFKMIKSVDGPNAQDELNVLYATYRAFWTPEHTEAGRVRLAQIRSDRESADKG
jgi:hypothetical protein